ncbi:MAG: TonB family protein [Candidatus Omnitrophica bacterium]|nr:TonB family protein [Candidatus Omnitrophota bacterium]MDE2214570.1 TonB family protein [Candidatus Omnitrophota bacterium]MDE2231647.1 TonB family protein [Candidatus Omnitrophota bacterium]
MPPLSADDDMQSADVIDMVVGDIQSVPASGLTRVSVTDPSVADISDVQNDKVSLIAKKAGSTVLFFWDAGGKHSVKVRVAAQDLNALKALVQELLKEAGVKGVSEDINLDIGKVVLTGSLSEDNKNRMADVLTPYSDNLLNLVEKEKNNELIQVDMQIVEINVTLERELGISWGTSSSGTTGSTGTSNSGQVNLNYGETLPTGDKFKDLFKIGHFMRTTSLEATVNALVKEGKARLISKPRLVVESGKPASFLVGGEIPIQSTTVSTTGSTLTNNTTYAQYGVNLSVTPTIQDGKIDVQLNVDIRDVDSATPISSNGGNVAFVTRTASTDLLMDNKQTIALAGLIKYEDSVNETDVPFLSKIPLLGGLFRNKSEPADANTEMVIILTPTVLTQTKYAQKELVMPTSEERSSWNEIVSRYEHAPIVSDWPAKPAPTAPSENPETYSPSFPLAPQYTAAYSAPAPLPVENLKGLPAATAYARMVQEKISRTLIYPRPVGGAELGGTVKLKLHILKDGSLDSIDVAQSSGSNVLDQDAMQAAKSAAPFAAFSPGMDQRELEFTVPIVFNPDGQSPAEKGFAS